MNVLAEYVRDTENPITNFNMARWYEDQSHHSPAAGYFLRAAELSENDLDTRYESLLRCYFCYNRAGRRDFTCESILKSAIILAPNRPEAYYFLSEHYERKNDWLNVFTFSSLGLKSYTELTKFKSYMYFDGIYQLHFKKAFALWWMGKSYECRAECRYILDNFIDELTPFYKDLLQSNLSRLAGGPEHLAFKEYTKKNYFNKFKFPFDGYENIDKNFAQTYQDMFLLALLNGKRNGTYLEIGSSHPYYGNNTALLEHNFDWTGVGIEYKSELVQEYRRFRKNPVIEKDATNLNYSRLLDEYFPNQSIIDYLQLDLEPSKNTFEAMLAIPFDKYQFRFITYEHDDYVDITKSYRAKSRHYLSSLGYKLVVNDVCGSKDCNFEDWWVKPELIDQDILAKMTTVSSNGFNNIEDVILLS